ncbi:MAG: hypothetical protein ABSB12_01820 [Candidatus Saccharimonadales bacterium]|jgi:predicted Rossmann-fold nucleotide-binding protein
MRIGIIGPNKAAEEKLAKHQELLAKVAEIVAKTGNDIVLTPDSNSLLEYFADKYQQYDGKKVWLVIPTDEPDHEDYLNTKLGEVISCQTWDRQADEFNRQCDVFVCVGYSWGAMKEIACAQYFNNKKVYILTEFISDKLPKELNFLVEYIAINDLWLSLNNHTQNT